MKALEAQHQASAAFIRSRIERAGGLSEAERRDFAALLRAQAEAWRAAGGEPAAFPGAEVLGVLAQAEQPAAPPAPEKATPARGPRRRAR